MQAGDVSVRLLADVAQFQRQMARAEALVQQTSANMISAFRGLAAPLAAAFSLGAIVQWTRAAIDAADKAGKLAQTIGVATEQVAGLQLAFRQSGLAAEQLGPVMSKLAAAIANGNKALDAMQVATRNADGSLRSTRDVLGDVAQRFAGYRDGAAKTALAVALLGEEGAKLVPLLNGGAAGLADMDAKARALGLTLDDKAAKAAAEFNDQLDLLRARSQGAVQSIGLGLLPVVNELLSGFSSATDATDRYKGVVEALRIPLEAISIAAANVKFVLESVGREIGAVAAQIVTLGQLDIDGFNAISEAVKEDGRRARAELDAFEQRVLNAGRRAAATATAAAAASNRPAAPTIGTTATDPFGVFANRALAAQRQRDIDAAIKAEQDLTKALQKEAADRAKAAEDEYEALRRTVEGWTRTQLEAYSRNADAAQSRLATLQDEEAAIAMAAQRNVSLAEAIELVAIARLYEASVGLDANDVRAQAIDREIAAREQLVELMRSRAARDANQQAAEQAARDWSQITQQIGQSLTDALMNGSMKAGDFIKRLFSTMVLRPVIQAVMNPIMGAMGSALGFSGAASAATGGASAASTGMSAIGAMGTLGAYGSLFGSGATLAMAGNTMGALSSAGAMMSAGATGSGLAMGAGALAPWVIGGMILINGLSRKLKDVGIQGTFGGDAGFSGEQYRFYKGGFLRSNKTTTQALDAEMQGVLSGTFTQIRSSTAEMARQLGLSADALDSFTKDIKFSLKGLTEEQIQQKLTEEFGKLGDEMARLVMGAGGSAQALQQLYQAVMQQREQLEVRLLELQGNTVALRERERATIHETNLALYDSVQALEDYQAAAKAASEALTAQINALRSELDQALSERLSIAQAVVGERTTLEERLLQLQGNTAALRERELAAMDPLNRAFARFVFAAEDAKTATEQVAQRMSALADAGAGIAAFVAELQRGSSGASSIGALRAQYQATLALARQGNVQASGRIVGEARALIDASQARARTRTEADIIASRIAAELSALPATKSWEQQQTELLQTIATQGATAQTGQDAILKATQEGFAYLDTTADGLLTLDELKTGLAGIATDKQIKSLVTRVDANGDGFITQLELAVAAVGTLETNLVAKLATEFATLDTTADGLLTLDELKTGLAGIATDEQIKALVTRVDANGDGFITQLELAVAAVGTLESNLLAKLATEFLTLDTTADGLLTLDELKTGLAGIATDEQIKALISAVDINGDGQIDELELLQSLTGGVQQNTLETLRSNETQISALRDLIKQTVVNSQSLNTLNLSIELLSNSLIQATEAEKAAKEAEIKRASDLQKANLLNIQGEQNKKTSYEAQQAAQSSIAYLKTEQNSLTSAVDQLLGIWEYGSSRGSHQEVIKRYSEIADNVPVNTQSGTAEQRLEWANLILQAGGQASGAFSRRGMSAWNSAINAFVSEISDQDGFANYSDILIQINEYQKRLDSANKIIDSLEALRQQIISLGGVPTFAEGGLHAGGLRLVGENGPELEVTGPARYWSSAETAQLFGNSTRRDQVLVAEIRALRAEVTELRAEARSTAVATNKTARILDRVTPDGNSLQTVAAA
jgi:Ca2+-binding EF-hand superfamily protein